MVYVDDMRTPFGRMLMCHMIADTTAELLVMADKIGMKREWLQAPGTTKEHFDLSLAKRRQALLAGAKAITRHEMGEILKARRLAAAAAARRPQDDEAHEAPDQDAP